MISLIGCATCLPTQANTHRPPSHKASARQASKTKTPATGAGAKPKDKNLTIKT